MVTVSGRGTVTWQEPKFFVSYDNQTGAIKGIGQPAEGLPSFEVPFEIVEKFLSGSAFIQDYAVLKDGDQLTIRKTDKHNLVFKSYPVQVTDSDYPKARITRSIKNKTWVVELLTTDPIFVFVCEASSKSNYIRTLSITQSGEYTFIYDSEQLAVSLYANEKNSEIKYQDE